MTGTGDPEQLDGNPISPALMRVLGLWPVAGRTFTDDEEKPGSTHCDVGAGNHTDQFASIHAAGYYV